MWCHNAIHQEEIITIDTSAPQQLEFVVKDEPMEVEPVAVAPEEQVVPQIVDRQQVNIMISSYGYLILFSNL